MHVFYRLAGDPTPNWDFDQSIYVDLLEGLGAINLEAFFQIAKYHPIWLGTFWQHVPVGYDENLPAQHLDDPGSQPQSEQLFGSHFGPFFIHRDFQPSCALYCPDFRLSDNLPGLDGGYYLGVTEIRFSQDSISTIGD